MKQHALRCLAVGMLVFIAGCALGPAPSQSSTSMPLSTGAVDPASGQEAVAQDMLLPTFTPPPISQPAPATPTEIPTLTVCRSGCDTVTLQDAIQAANPNGGDVIAVLDPVLTEAGIIIDRSLTIQGLGADVTVLQAAASLDQAPDRVLWIEEGVTVTLQDITIQHGYPPEQPNSGGGIANFGTLTLERCVISHNQAGDGGGIWNKGILTLIDSMVWGNKSDGIAPPAMECGSGGGINNAFGTTLTLINSTVYSNTAVSKGGGLHVACEGTATLTNSTVSGNRAGRMGGGIHLRGHMVMEHSTISGNRSGEEGGGIYVRGSMDYSNSIIADNGKSGDCFIGGPGDYRGKGEIGLNTFNLVEDGGCDAAFVADPVLGPLGDYGGLAKTQMILAGSPAIDVVPLESCLLSADQRGAPRPIPVLSLETPCDIGAVEFSPVDLEP
jgi:hypothetical protein